MYRWFSILLALVTVAEVVAALPARTRDPYWGAIVVDADTRTVLMEDRADEPAYPASTLKMMTLLLAIECVEQGRVQYGTPIPVTAEAQAIGGSQVYLAAGESFPLEEMLYALMVQSANDAATAIAIHLAGSRERFVQWMNRRAAQLGMQSTRFASVHGLPPSTGQEADITTARDFAALSLALLQKPDASRFISAARYTFRPNAKEPLVMVNHNPLLGDGTGVDGIKTGFIRAGGFSIAATAVRNGRRVIAVVLGSATKEARNRSVRELLDRGFALLPTLPPPAPPVEVVAPAPVPEPAVVEPEVSTPRSDRLWLWASLGVLVLVGFAFAVRPLLRPKSGSRGSPR